MDELGEVHFPGHHEPAASSSVSGAFVDSDSVAMHDIGHTSIYESVHVLVRVRPLSQLEIIDNQDSVVDIVDKQSLTVTSSDGKKVFKCTYDSVLGISSTQLDVYDVVRNCTESVLDGFNSTIFAYGQTGSGKVSEYCCTVEVELLLMYAKLTTSACTDVLHVRPSDSPEPVYLLVEQWSSQS